jgi:hypothetical protein
MPAEENGLGESPAAVFQPEAVHRCDLMQIQHPAIPL